MRIALYQPDIPQNLGTLLRLAACMQLPVDIIEPCGFPWSDTKLKRAGMDYMDHVEIIRHVSFEAFTTYRETHLAQHRVALLSTKATYPYTEHVFTPETILMVGRESAGVPPHVHAYADDALLIPMQPPMRSLNVAIAAAMVVGEALRQTQLFPRFLP